MDGQKLFETGMVHVSTDSLIKFGYEYTTQFFQTRLLQVLAKKNADPSAKIKPTNTESRKAHNQMKKYLVTPQIGTIPSEGKLKQLTTPMLAPTANKS